MEIVRTSLVKTMDRAVLVETLRDLLTDEYDPSEVAFMTESEIIKRIIEAAYWYQQQANSKND